MMRSLDSWGPDIERILRAVELRGLKMLAFSKLLEDWLADIYDPHSAVMSDLHPRIKILLILEAGRKRNLSAYTADRMVAAIEDHGTP